MPAQSGYAVVGTSPFDARIRVGYEGALKELVRIVKVKMVYNAVAEHGSEHFALFGIFYHESTSRVVPRTSVSVDRHTTRSGFRLSSARTSARMTSCAYAVLHHSMPHIGRTAAAGASAYNLRFLFLPFFLKKLLRGNKKGLSSCLRL